MVHDALEVKSRAYQQDNGWNAHNIRLWKRAQFKRFSVQPYNGDDQKRRLNVGGAKRIKTEGWVCAFAIGLRGIGSSILIAGIYYDPRASDLELQNELRRDQFAEKLRSKLIKNNISKFNCIVFWCLGRWKMMPPSLGADKVRTNLDGVRANLTRQM